MQAFIHYFLHIIFPILISKIFFRNEWKKVYLIFLITMVVDLDHLIATPVFQANRCSIGFHPLHSFFAIGGYIVLLLFRKPYNLIGMGLLFHMLTDFIDCNVMFSKCMECLANSPIYETLKFLSKIYSK